MKPAPLVLALFLAAAAPLAARADDGSPAADRAARVELARGLLRSGRASEALAAAEQALAAGRGPDALAALGEAELRLGHARAAAEHLDEALRATRDDDRAWPEILYNLVEAKRHVLTLRVDVDLPGARVLVDDVPVGEAPLRHDVFVEPGAHVVAAELAGSRLARLAIRGRSGERITVQLRPGEVARGAPPPPAPPAPLAVKPRETPGRNPWIIAGGAITGAAVFAVGNGYVVASMTSGGNQDASNRNAAICLTAGGAILGATLAYALWPRAAAAPTVGAAPLVLERGAGASIGGAY